MGASQHLMGGSVTFWFQHQKKQSIKLHIFLVTTSAMESTYKQLVMPGVGLFFFHTMSGGAGDSQAFYGTKLDVLLKGIPHGFYDVADNAYTLSATLIIPYSGNDKKYPEKFFFQFLYVAVMHKSRAIIWHDGEQMAVLQMTH
jgi:hypothetical protein